MWLLPGIVGLVFQVDPLKGDYLFQSLLTELERRVSSGELDLTEDQVMALLSVHEELYCSEYFRWNPAAHMHPFCRSLREIIGDSTEG